MTSDTETYEHEIGPASLSAALARAPAEVVVAQARTAWSRLTAFRAREEMRHSDSWTLVQYALEWRDDEIVHGFVLECWRSSEGECDAGDQMFGYVDKEKVVPEQWS